MANSEIEKRVALSVIEAEAAIAQLNEQGVEWDSNERLLMDFSGSLENRELQVMVRVNNGVPEMSIKKGGVADVVRQEASVYVSSGLESLLDAVGLLGYEQANYGLRSMKTCEIDGLQYSFRFIRDINNPEQCLGVNLEIEALAGSTEADIDAAIGGLGLTPLSESETQAFFARLHEEANAEYIHSEEAASHIVNLAEMWASGGKK